MKKHNKKDNYILTRKQIIFLNKFVMIVVVLIFMIILVWYFKLNLYFTDRNVWYYHLGDIYYSAGEYSKALQYAKKAVHNGYENPEVHRLLVKTYLRIRKFDEAKEELTSSKGLNGSSFYYREMGKIMRIQGMLNESLYYHKKGVEEFPFSKHAVGSFLDLGLTYLELNETENALIYLNKSKVLVEQFSQSDFLNKNGLLGQIHMGLGYVYQIKGLHQKAEEEFKIVNSFKLHKIQYISILSPNYEDH
tara:strand:- start:106 stop:849 length:744 start_codon:yes stop_codon:yes gene_type:complete